MAAGTFIFLDHTPLHSALEQVEGLDPSPIIHAGLASAILAWLAILVVVLNLDAPESWGTPNL